MAYNFLERETELINIIRQDLYEFAFNNQALIISGDFDHDEYMLNMSKKYHITLAEATLILLDYSNELRLERANKIKNELTFFNGNNSSLF